MPALSFGTIRLSERRRRHQNNGPRPKDGALGVAGNASNARVLRRASRCKRSPCQVHGIEQKLRFKRLAKMCGLTKSVLLILEYKQTGRDISALKRGIHPLRLVDRHDRIVLTVEEYHWSGQPIGEIDRRTVVVKCAVRPKRLDKPVGVMQPQFMSLGGECDQIMAP